MEAYKIQKQILEAMESSKKAAVITVIKTEGSAPQKPGAKMIVYEDKLIVGTIGGGAIEFKLTEDALNVIESGKAQMFSYNLGAQLGMCCGGKMDAFIEPTEPLKKLVIFGAGHISAELVPLAKKIGFHVTVIDDREDFANKERLPQADEVIFEHYDYTLDKLTFDNSTFIVIVTHQHKYDDEILTRIIDKEYAYLGMIGSKTKFEKTKLRLKSQNFSDQIISKVHTPIGIKISAKTPFEIALSISCELVNYKYI
ncbi:MAG: xanthine dehydrogenase accessory protein XdhC [Pseudomonadota bacterium]